MESRDPSEQLLLTPNPLCDSEIPGVRKKTLPMASDVRGCREGCSIRRGTVRRGTVGGGRCDEEQSGEEQSGGDLRGLEAAGAQPGAYNPG